MKALLFCLVVLPGMLLSPSLVRAADDVGPTGVVHSVQVLTSSSDAYIQYHGFLVVEETGTNDLVEYRWGGTSCGSIILNDAQLALLFDLAASPYMEVTPRHQPGQGVTKCLVGFEARNAKFQ